MKLIVLLRNCTWLDFAVIGRLRSLAEFSIELLTLSNRESNWEINSAVPMADSGRPPKLTYVHIEAATASLRICVANLTFILAKSFGGHVFE